MPLESGKSQTVLGRNIATEIRAGKPRAQVAAIAYSKARGDVSSYMDPTAQRSDFTIGKDNPDHPHAIFAKLDELSAKCDDLIRSQLDDTHHGHVTPVISKEGHRLRARCGGPGRCHVCDEEKRRLGK